MDFSFGGYADAFLAYTGMDANTGTGADDGDGIKILSDAEVFFLPSITLDNGIRIGANIQLEGESDGNLEADDTYLFIKGSFGEVQFGTGDSASTHMQYGAPGSFGFGFHRQGNEVARAFPIVGMQSGVFRAEQVTGVPLGTTYLENDGRDRRVGLRYLSPQFAGFTFGASYQRDDSTNADPLRSFDPTACDYWDVALRYAGEFGGVRVAAGIGYGQGNTNDPGADPQVFRFDLGVKKDGWAIGGAYAEQSGSSGGAFDGSSFEVGVERQQGPWTLGLNHFSGRMIDWRHIGFGPRISLTSTYFTAEREIECHENARLGAFVGWTCYDEDVGDAGFGTPGNDLS